MLVTIIILSTFSPASAVVTYGPGVVPGEWAKYGRVSASWTSNMPGEPAPPPIGDLLDTSGVRTEVSTVSGQEITARQNRMFTNGTSRETTLSGDVETGQGNLTFWIISGGLSQGDRIFDNQAAPTLNATINRVYLGSARTVNVLNITETIAFSGGTFSVSAVAFWDRPAGVLMEIHFTETFTSPFYSASGSASAIITETNLWTTQSDFAIYANPIKTLQAGGSVDSKIYLTSLNGFAGYVAIAAFVNGYQGIVNGLSASFDPSVSKLTPDGTNSSVLTVTADASTPTGYYTINVTATSDIGIYHYGHYLLISVRVNSPPTPGTYVPGVEPSDDVWYGTIRTYWGSIIPIQKPPFITDFENVSWVDLEVRSVSGTTVTAVQTWAFANDTSRMVTISGDVSSGTGLFPWIIAGALDQGDRIVNQPLAPTINATISKTYAGATRLVNVFNFTYSIAGVNTKLVYFWDKTTGVLLEQFYNITATGAVEGLSDVKATTTNMWLPAQPDFQITSTPSSLAIQKGSTITSSFTLRSLNGFAGTIQLSPVSSPGLSASMDRASVSIDEDQIATATLSISSEAGLSPGNYNVNVTGSSNSVSHAATISVMVSAPPDFTVSFSAASVTLQAGTSATSAVAVIPQNGFAGTVQLSTASSNPKLSASLDMQSVSLDDGQAEMRTLTISTASDTSPGSYNVNVTGSTSSLSHRITISVVVTPAQDFTLTMVSPSLSVQAGASTTTSMTITPQNGFTGTVGLTASAPNGLTVALNPTSLAGSGTFTVTITTDITLAAGSYNIIVTATKGSLSHSETITVTVKAATVSHVPAVFGLDPTIFYTSLVAVVLAVLAIIVFLRRRARPVPTSTTMPSGP